MAEKTIVEKAGFAIGMGLAAADDAAGAIKTAIDSAMTAVAGAIKKEPALKAKKTGAHKGVAAKTTEKVPRKESATKKGTRNARAKKSVKKASAKAAKKAANAVPLGRATKKSGNNSAKKPSRH